MILKKITKFFVEKAQKIVKILALKFKNEKNSRVHLEVFE